MVGVLGHTKGGGEERRERRLPFQSVMYRREESKFLFSSLIKAAANPHPFPPCHPAAGSGGRGQLGVSAPFSLSFTSGGGVGAMQPASRRIERTPWAGVSGEPARLCAGSEARYGHPRPPPPTFPSRPRLYAPAGGPRCPAVAPCACLPQPRCPVTRGWSLFYGCALSRLPRAEWLGRGDRVNHLDSPECSGGNRAAGDAPTAGFCARAPAGSGGLWLCTCHWRGCGVWWRIGFESSVIFSKIL